MKAIFTFVLIIVLCCINFSCQNDDTFISEVNNETPQQIEDDVYKIRFVSVDEGNRNDDLNFFIDALLGNPLPYDLSSQDFLLFTFNESNQSLSLSQQSPNSSPFSNNDIMGGYNWTFSYNFSQNTLVVEGNSEDLIARCTQGNNMYPSKNTFNVTAEKQDNDNNEFMYTGRFKWAGKVADTECFSVEGNIEITKMI